MAFLQQPSESPTNIKLTFGKLCFKLKAETCFEPALTWPELQKLRLFQDFLTRWINVIDRTSPAIVALLEELEGRVVEDEKPQGVLSVYLENTRQETLWGLKYDLVDGMWKLRGCRFAGRKIRVNYDVLVDNDMSFRVRAFTRKDPSDTTPNDLHRHLDISIPPHGDLFETTVTLKTTAPTGLTIKVGVKTKVHVDHRGLRFSVGYVDRLHSEFRIECGLSSSEKEKLGPGDNECQVLTDKVLRMLSNP